MTARATGPDDLASVRLLVGEAATAAGLDPARADMLIVAVNEIVTNAITHGRPPATVTITSTGAAVRVTVNDHGSGLARGDPSIRIDMSPPGPERPSGRGLWLATRLCDRVDLHSDPGGTTITLVMATPGG
jgi:serine/threonine-protein kinase RsbW